MTRDFLFAILCAALLGACAAAPKGIGKGETVTFVEDPPSAPAPTVELSNAAIGENAKTGTGTGMLVGAVAGLSCGIAAIVCSPVGAVVGGLGGAIMGAGAGLVQGLPPDVQAQLQRRVETLAATHDVRRGMMTAIAQRGTGHWVASSAGVSSSVVRVRIDGVKLYSDQTGRVGLWMRVTILSPTDDGPRGTVEKSFEYVGVSSEPRLWIDDPDEFVLTSFRHGYAHVAQNVFAYLAR